MTDSASTSVSTTRTRPARVVPAVTYRGAVISVSMSLPRPSERVLHSPRERSTAMDWHAMVVVRSWQGRGSFGIALLSGEGEVTLHRGGTGWVPCRSLTSGPDLLRSDGRLAAVLEEIRRIDPMGIEAARQARGVLSGASWTPGEQGASRTLEASPAIIPGDVVEHHGSMRVGVVLEVGRIHDDGTIEYRVRVREEDGHLEDRHWWSSSRVRRIGWRDPYRRYLAMRWREDDLDANILRARRRKETSEAGPERRIGRDRHGWLTAEAWNRLYWRLVNSLPRDPGRPLLRVIDGARPHWEEAALDCLARRDRIARYSHGLEGGR